ncbi:MAG: hypothetical protein LBP19_01510 [Treponema sp.]|jgi:hypothetical protein|nr:hypothetical protein [Treponema sp.]
MREAAFSLVSTLSRIPRIRSIRGIRFPLLILLLALTAAAHLPAQTAAATLAILPFTGTQAEDGETIAELFSFQKELTAVFSPVPRTSINRAIRNERGFQMTSGMTDPDTIAALGKQLGAKYVVAGAITNLGSHNLLVIAILHTEDLRQIAGDIQTYTTIEEIEGKLPSIARTIAAALKRDAANLPMLAVPPVQWSGGASNREADLLAQILAVHLVQSGKYAVYPRTKSLDQVQEEYGNQFGGDTADEYLPVIGKGTNPRHVLSVTARKLGSINKFNAAVINLETGIQIAGESADYTNLDDGMRAMEELALKLTGQEHVLAQREQERRNAEAAAAAAKAEQERRAAEEKALRNAVVGTQSAFAQAIAAINNDKNGGAYTITLTGNVASDSVVFTGNTGKIVTLKGNGTTRAISNNGNNVLFIVPESVTLVLENGVTLNGNGKVASLVYIKGGTLIMKSGSTIRSAQHSGVYVDRGGTFTMEGGEISGNTASRRGSTGDHVYGGGVYVAGSGTFTMEGGEIRGNTAPSSSGGGVCVGEKGTFTMKGGEISGNTTGSGGGVFVWEKGTFTMKGGEISGNTAGSGGGVYVWGTFMMEGGQISNNTASNGGGVYVYGRFTKRSGGTIDATNSANSGKVVYVVSSSSSKQRNSAAGPYVTLDSHISGSAGGWE